MRSLVLRSVVSSVLAASALSSVVALLGWGEYSNWKGQVASVEKSLEQTAEALTQHADDLIEMSRLPLSSLIVEIRDNQGSPDLQEKIDELIMRQLKASPTIRTLSYLGPDGKLVATSADPHAIGSDYSERDYFQYHKSSPFPLAVLGKPVKSRLSYEWVLPISQRVVFADGSFGGVVVSTIPVNHFINFFRNFGLGPQASFLLVRGDGMILARGPMAENVLGSDMSSQALFTDDLKKYPSGAHHYRSRNDGIDRIGGFYQSTRTGIVGLAAESERDTFLKWVATAKIRWFYGGVLLLVAALAFLYWRRQTGLKEANARLLEAREAEFRLLAESSSDVISRFDENGIREYVSPSSRNILGLPPEQLIGKSVFANMPPETLLIVKAAAERMLAGSRHEKFVTPHRKPDGTEVWLETALSALPAPDGGSASRVVAVTRDVTRHKLEQDALDLLANSDELTRLSNRRLFNIRFDEMMLSACQGGHCLSLLMIDADRFKLYNDTYGHAAGDECLRQIAGIIRQCVRRPGDIAARYGGEEMAVLLSGTDASGAQDVAEAIRTGIEALAIPHENNGPFGRVTVSIGTATYSARPANIVAVTATGITADNDSSEAGLEPEGAATAEALFSDADAALYKAKSRGRNRVVAGGRPAVLLRSVN